MEMLLYLQMLYAIIPILCTSLIRNFGWKHIYCVTNFTYREETRSERGSLNQQKCRDVNQHMTSSITNPRVKSNTA